MQYGLNIKYTVLKEETNLNVFNTNVGRSVLQINKKITPLWALLNSNN